MSDLSLISVAHIFMIREGQILLLRRCNTGHEDGRYGLPAGRLERGEKVHSAAAREAAEECGISIAPEDLQMISVMHINTSYGERVDFFFAAHEWNGEVRNCEPDKCDDLRWFPLGQLPVNLIPFIRQALDNYLEGVWFSEFGYE
ncbi:NUDIX hydrolase [Paenibacillus sp. PK3_47]|uniref:NUDIX hydrolase n=1 Tax=Paenibacillus sp. PK3_47 TaxID=2072642 RepID=UPI00201E5428|nr:NUDIX domain-containing protein [Paenibacillus sp. PK3_47]UQZ36647.1 NUDIX hydrolase [Paenibacillus sp. PK3_47]